MAQATTLVARSPITLDISVAGHASTRLLSELRAKAFAVGHVIELSGNVCRSIPFQGRAATHVFPRVVCCDRS